MDMLHFLEQMACSAHHDRNLHNLIETQPIDVKLAYNQNDSLLLKKIIGETGYIANPSDVAQF